MENKLVELAQDVERLTNINLKMSSEIKSLKRKVKILTIATIIITVVVIVIFFVANN